MTKLSTTQRFVLWLVLLLASALALAVWLIPGYPFTGDGVLTDHGFWSYPRYRIIFSKIDPKVQPQSTLAFTGAPHAKMTFGLLIVGRDGVTNDGVSFPDPMWEPAILDVTVEKVPEKVVAHVQAPISAWTVARSSERTMLWDSRLRDLPFERTSSYRLTIKLSGLAPAAPGVTFAPILEGGGNELPGD